MPKKSLGKVVDLTTDTAILKDLEEIPEDSDQEEDSFIEKAKVEKPEKVDRRKKGAYVRTQKQIDAFEKVKAIRQAKRDERKEIREKTNAEMKMEKEEKITKKALSIKKKQILRDADLDAISDDDEIPVEVVKKILVKYPKKKAPPATPREPVYRQQQQPVYDMGMNHITFI